MTALDPRRVAMLAEMGIRVWTRPVPAEAVLELDARPATADPRSPFASPAARPGPRAPVAPPPRDARPVDEVAVAPGNRLAPDDALDAAPPPARPAAAPVRLRTDVPPPGTDTPELDWPALRDAVAACAACALGSGRTQALFGAGQAPADWMVVGEAPGEQDDREGDTFTGKPGQLLDNMLRAVGLTREPATPDRQAYLTHAVKCRPPGNRNPAPDELAACEPFLLRQIALVQPKVILALGRFAVQSLLHSTEPIGRLRGQVHQVAGVPVVVTYHPAYLLRNPEDKGRAWEDLCLARELCASAR